MSNYSFPVDAVYLWVDGNDPAWQKKRHKALKEAQKNNLQISEESLAAGRFRDNDELRYSLRSLELYAPWINQVHIITDGQCPKWLNRPAVNLVDHTEILPENAAYPVFNSNLIELCMHRIGTLSEHFISFNDDIMLGSPVRKKDFFTLDGRPKLWVTQKNLKKFKKKLANTEEVGLHQKSIMGTNHMAIKKYGAIMPYGFKHCPRSYTKSSMEELWGEFPQEVSKSLQMPFRHEENIVTFILYSLFMLATNKGQKRQLDGIYKLKDLICGRICNINIDLGDHRCFKRMKKIKKYKPLTFCINDCGTPTGDERIHILQDFLAEIFSKKSKFEI